MGVRFKDNSLKLFRRSHESEHNSSILAVFKPVKESSPIYDGLNDSAVTGVRNPAY